MATEITDPELEQASWNLEDLVDGQGAAGVERLLDEAQQLADAFADRYAGKVGDLDGPGLETAMRELERVADLGGRAGSFAHLDFSVDTQDPARGALVARVTERSTAIETKLVFFELEWAAIDDDRAEEVLRHPGLDFARHYLRTARRYRPHLLSEPEEKLMAEKSQTGRSAWGRLFAELMSAVEVDGQPLEVALSRLMHPDREVRRTTAEAVTEALQPGLRTRAYIFNTLVLDKSVDDRLRNYSSWIQSRNLSNEASDESVEALVEAVQSRYEIARRWYRLKAKLLGIDRLADYDRIAPVTEDEQRIEWSDARRMVLESYTAFSPDLGRLAGRFFDERWIDAPVRPRKRGGAFCAYTVPSAHPYVLLNYTARRRDVLTLAHELGHGVHAALAREQGVFQQGTPLTLAETASVFGEELVFGRLLDEAQDAESRLALLAEAMEGQIATVFRQIAMNRFEHALHTARREEGELAIERIGELWRASQEALLGDAVEVTEGYGTWWSYVPHFVNTPGYVYAYAYGQLLALSVYRRYEDEGESFVPAYLELLRTGGSKSPEEIGAIVGVDLADPGFWDSGLDLVERQLEAAEAAARDARGVTP
ncbi:MAG TPA: M3 family oligoendopeptidase [Solirubrobacteraceae bacterium]|nr:M3 family oligoendopeptidase [Solirubrobacteraceae bacterium]